MAFEAQAGAVSSHTYRDSYEKLVTKGVIENTLQWGIWKFSPFMEALGLNSFGVEAISNFKAFGQRSLTGSVLEHNGGSYVEGQIMDGASTLQHVGRFGSFTPSYKGAGNNWAYAHTRLIGGEFIPDMDVQDNAGPGRIIDIKSYRMQALLKTAARDFNYTLLGNSSAPDFETAGATLMKTDLKEWLGVTNVTVGGLSQSATADDGSTTYWQPQRKAITSLGGGGDLDRPITLRRSMMKLYNDASALAEQMNQFLLVCTQGAWQTWDRLFYADAQERDGALGKRGTYDAAGIEHKVFRSQPMVWDPAAATPNGATTSTEAIYGIHIPSYGLSFHSEEGPTFDGWEPPRAHDQYRTDVLQFRMRYTPIIRNMRPHMLGYNIPQNAD